MVFWMNYGYSPRDIESADSFRGDSNLPHTPNYRQQYLSTFKTRTAVLPFNSRVDTHQVSQLNSPIAKIVHPDDGNTRTQSRSRLNNTVSYRARF